MKNKNIFIIPTDKPSRLGYDFDFKQYYVAKTEVLSDNQELLENRNIYITSDEVKKNGEWVLSKLNEVVKFCSLYCQNNYKKIILTDNKDLIKDGVQAIDDEFLEWFVKNPSCESVEVVFNNRGITGTEKILKTFGEYKIIIPKEEPKQETIVNGKCFKCGNSQYKVRRPFCTDEFCNKDFYQKPKQEILEESRANSFIDFAKSNKDVSMYSFVAGFNNGAKWQMERSYSEEDMKLSFEAGKKRGNSGYSNTDNFRQPNFEEFIEQFKNK